MTACNRGFWAANHPSSSSQSECCQRYSARKAWRPAANHPSSSSQSECCQRYSARKAWRSAANPTFAWQAQAQQVSGPRAGGFQTKTSKTSNDAGLLRMRRDQLQSKEANCIQLNIGFSLKSPHAVHPSAQYHRAARSKASHWKASTTEQPGQKLYTGRLAPQDSQIKSFTLEG